MRTTKPLILCAILLASCIPLANVAASSQEVCCDSTPVELFLLGPASSGELSPFEAALSEESEEKKISDAIAQQEEIEVGKLTLLGPALIPRQHGSFRLIMKSQMRAVHKSMHLSRSKLEGTPTQEQLTNPTHFWPQEVAN